MTPAAAAAHAAQFDLTGRVALITGASRGLGAAIARGMARAGAEVVLNGRMAGTLEGDGSSVMTLDCGLSRTLNLDRGTADKVFAQLMELCAEHSTSLIIVTHDQTLATRAGRVLHLEDGQLC